MIKGHIHSIESLGTVDGPGLRYILFTQGCLLRCQFCHNPDTWEIGTPSREVTAEEMVEEIVPYIPYFNASGGGVTISGGEPLLQLPFIEQLFRRLKEEGIKVHRYYVGEFATAMEMAGFSISLFKLDDELKELLDAPAATPFFKQL